MEININRLMNNLISLGTVGQSEDGVSREAFTPKYFEGVTKLKEMMEDAGLSAYVDKVGNVYGLKSGKAGLEQTIIVGSHLDTVKNGGLYDGNLGINGALECMATLRDKGYELNHNIAVVGFNCEEGGLLGGTFGSRVAMGNQDVSISDIEGKLKKYNLTKEDILDSKLTIKPKCFLELHIEQGANLHNENVKIGLVKGIVGITRYKIIVEGEQNHGGTAAMSIRKDALVAASELIVEINKEANKMAEPFVATVGKIDVVPNSVNVVPGKVEMILELREMEKFSIENFVDKIRDIASNLNNCKFSFEPYSHKDSVYLSEKIIDIGEKICKEHNISYKKMYSGAGHDAMEFSKSTDTGLIFIPSVNGISHSKEELSLTDDIKLGTEMLLNTIVSIDMNCN